MSEPIEEVVETSSSSSNIVLRTHGPIQTHGLEITLRPMRRPVTKIDVYPSEVMAFVKALDRLFHRAEEADDDG